jgi:uncharacterized protein (TIRG00374 family)
MNKKHLIIGIVIVVLSFSYAFKNVSIEELGSALKSVQYLYLIPSLFFVALTFLFRTMRWRYLVGSVKEVKTADLASPMMIGFMSNILPARAGELIRAYLLGKKENISFSASFATIFVERLMDMMLFLGLLVGVMLYSSDILARGNAAGSHDLVGTMKSFGWFSFVVLIGICVFSGLLQYKNTWAMRIVGVCVKPLPLKWKDKITGMVHSFTEGLSILKDPKGFMASVILTFFVWAAMISVYYPIYLAFGIEAELPMISSLVILSLTVGIFISVLPTPAFLGSFQLACVVALHDIFGISEAVSASYGIVAWLVNMGFIILAGLVFILKDNISFAELTASKDQATP